MAGTCPVVALMVGTAVQTHSWDGDGGVAMDDRNGTDDDMSNSTVTASCDASPVDVAVTLSLLVGIFMVRY